MSPGFAFLSPEKSGLSKAHVFGNCSEYIIQTKLQALPAKINCELRFAEINDHKFADSNIYNDTENNVQQRLTSEHIACCHDTKFKLNSTVKTSHVYVTRHTDRKIGYTN